MGFLKKAVDFVARPTNSRTMGLLLFFVLVAAVSLTVYVAQQQQQIRQRAASKITEIGDDCDNSGYLSCSSGQTCKYSSCDNVEGEEYFCEGTCISALIGSPTPTSQSPSPICESDKDCPPACNPTGTNVACQGSGKYKSCIYSSLKPNGGACQIAEAGDTCDLACPTASTTTTTLTPGDPTVIPSPASTGTPTPTPKVFDCSGTRLNLEYTCSDTKGSCPDGWSSSDNNNSANYPGGTTCNENQNCCRRIFSATNPTSTPTPTISGPTPTPTLPPPPTPTAVSGGEECFVYYWSSNDTCSGARDGGGDASCGTYSSADIGICIDTGSTSRKVAYCNACSPPPPILGPTATATPAPQSTPAPGDIVIQQSSASLNKMFGGKDGKLISGKNQDLTIYLYKSTDDPGSDPEGKSSYKKSKTTLLYDKSKKEFAGFSINLGQVTAGSYKILLKSPKYLRKLIGIQTIASTGGTITLIPNVNLANGMGDVNDDNKLNIRDYNAIAGCFGNKINNSSCIYKDSADLNDDGSVDGIDYNIFLTSLSLTERIGD